ncbi:hypothetical protein D3C87_190820 [compost metagenome]
MRGFDIGSSKFFNSYHRLDHYRAGVIDIMEMGSPVVLLSAFGRGHWLAAALAQEGIKTTLIDVTSKLGVWPSEDVEGPFGFFRTDRISESKMERIYADDPFAESVNGFTVWLKEGPIEFKGPLTRFKLEKSSLTSEAIAAILEGSQNKLSRNVQQQSFSESWLIDLAHQWASTTYVPSAKGYTRGRALPLAGSFFVRGATRAGLEKSLKWLEGKGVEVIRPQEIFDISFGQNKTINGIELRGEMQGLWHTEQMVWMLSSEETYFLNEKIGKYFFPEGALESEWCWVRYRVGLQECFERNSLPLHTLVIEDVYSPWTHENFMVLQRTAVDDQFDVWMRIPTVQRFNKEYLTLRSVRMAEHLTARMPLTEPQVLSYPQEYYYTYAQLGAPRFAVFGENQSHQRALAKFKNIYLDGPEVWTQYAWEAYFESHQEVRGRIVSWWKDKLLREQKEKRKEQNS